MNIIAPNILTLITTYKCTAACENCCFNCNPQYLKMMSYVEMKEYITVCKETYPSISVVVFTGGECTLLKDDLFSAIRLCSDMGLITRIVSNGHWGTNKQRAREYVQLLVDNGLSELNISTGKDHLKYIPMSNVMNILEMSSLNEGIKGVVVSVEKRNDYENYNPAYELKKAISHFENENKLFIVESPWVNFKKRSTSFNENEQLAIDKGGCRNLFSGIQINPNGQLLSCCGLACEYTPLLKLGTFSKENLSKRYEEQFNDILKLWIYTEGPQKILSIINQKAIVECKHDCDFCLELLTNKHNINQLLKVKEEKAKEIMLKYMINIKTLIK